MDQRPAAVKFTLRFLRRQCSWGTRFAVGFVSAAPVYSATLLAVLSCLVSMWQRRGPRLASYLHLVPAPLRKGVPTTVGRCGRNSRSARRSPLEMCCRHCVLLLHAGAAAEGRPGVITTSCWRCWSSAEGWRHAESALCSSKCPLPLCRGRGGRAVWRPSASCWRRVAATTSGPASAVSFRSPSPQPQPGCGSAD